MATDGDVNPADPSASTLDDVTEQSREEAGAVGFDRWRRQSSLGGIGTGIARGLQGVFASPADEIAIVAAVPGEPPDADQRVRVVLDPDDPTKSVAIMPGASVDPVEPRTGRPRPEPPRGA